MEVEEALTLLGGVATRAQLLALVSRTDLLAALDQGRVCRVARGRYAGPANHDARVAAHRLTAVVCLESAALAHGWAVKAPPDLPQVCVPRNRRITSAQRTGVDLRRFDLAADEVREGVTTRERTLLDCGRHLPFDAALAVFDSALRSGVPARSLAALARDARGPGSAAVRRVAEVADGRAANPFESVLRAIADDVPDLRLRPQVPIYGAEFLGRPDLVDVDLRVVVEADSFAWHGSRAALASDARRYNVLVAHGWVVLRFAWEDVMFEPAYVRRILEAVTAGRTQRPQCGCRCA